MRASCIQQQFQSTVRQSQVLDLPVCSVSSFANVLQDCIKRKDFSQGEQAYSLIVKNGLQESNYLACLLIRLVAACGYLRRACHIFFSMDGQHNIHMWTAVIHAHVQHSHHEQALTYYQHMLLSSIKGVPATFVPLLKACDHLCDLEKGLLIHVEIAGQGLDGNLYVQSAILSMYASCGCLEDAHGLFSRWQIRDHALWSVMVKGFLQHKQLQKAFELFEEMQMQGLQPNLTTVLLLLNALSNTNCISEKEDFYSHIVYLGLDMDAHIKCSIMNMYFKCHRLTEASHIFKIMSLDRDVVAWNVMIAGLSDHGHDVDAFLMFRAMELEKMSPTDATFVPLLKCVASADEGRFVHMNIVMLGLELSVEIRSSLISMYVDFLCIIDGRNILDHTFVHDVASWSAMMLGYVEQGLNIQAFGLFKSMLQTGLEPDGYTFSCLLQATETLRFGYLFHADIVEQSLESNPAISNNIINMYCECGSLECAMASFDFLGIENVVSFSTLISGYVKNGLQGKALQVFLKLCKELVNFDRVSILCALKACTFTSPLTHVTLIYSAVVEQGFDQDIYIGIALVDSFAKLGSLENSIKVFQMLHAHEVATYSALVSGYVDYGHHEMALQLSKMMHTEGLKPDAITLVCMLRACSGMVLIKQGQLIHADVVKHGWELNMVLGSALINFYSYSGKVEDARKVFDGLCSRDIVVWCTIMSCYVEHENSEEAIELFKEMQKDSKPNNVMFLCVLKACSQLPNLHFGMSVHCDVSREGLESDPMVGHALVDMYCKCGCLNNAIDVFKDLKEQDPVSWSSLIAGCAEHGLSELIHRYFQSVQTSPLLPDAALFTCLLRACSHGGLIQEGLQLAQALSKDYYFLLIFEHWICLVDMLGRSGCVTEASEVVCRIPFQPSPVVWVSMLSTCVIHNEVYIATHCLAFLEELKCKDVMIGYTLMHNVYAAASFQNQTIFSSVKP
ncbi:hypothetical protein L7F22_008150 [Adiantum nelumboides]|nr:hypothetical protein [Adiantum nelumboides]